MLVPVNSSAVIVAWSNGLRRDKRANIATDSSNGWPGQGGLS